MSVCLRVCVHSLYSWCWKINEGSMFRSQCFPECRVHACAFWKWIIGGKQNSPGFGSWWLVYWSDSRNSRWNVWPWNKIWTCDIGANLTSGIFYLPPSYLCMHWPWVCGVCPVCYGCEMVQSPPDYRFYQRLQFFLPLSSRPISFYYQDTWVIKPLRLVVKTKQKSPFKTTKHSLS